MTLIWLNHPYFTRQSVAHTALWAPGAYETPGITQWIQARGECVGCYCGFSAVYSSGSPQQIAEISQIFGHLWITGGEKKGRKKEMSWVWKSVRDLFGILHMAASGISFDPLLLIARELVHCSPTHIYGKRFPSSPFRGLPNGERSSLHSNVPSNHLLNLAFSFSSSMLLIQHLKSILCSTKDSE